MCGAAGESGSRRAASQAAFRLGGAAHKPRLGSCTAQSSAHLESCILGGAALHALPHLVRLVAGCRARGRGQVMRRAVAVRRREEARRKSQGSAGRFSSSSCKLAGAMARQHYIPSTGHASANGGSPRPRWSAPVYAWMRCLPGGAREGSNTVGMLMFTTFCGACQEQAAEGRECAKRLDCWVFSACKHATSARQPHPPCTASQGCMHLAALLWRQRRCADWISAGAAGAAAARQQVRAQAQAHCSRRSRRQQAQQPHLEVAPLAGHQVVALQVSRQRCAIDALPMGPWQQGMVTGGSSVTA